MNQTRFALVLGAVVAAVGGLMALMPEFLRGWEPFGPGSNFWRNIQAYGVAFGCLGMLLLVMALYYRSEFEHPPAYRESHGGTFPA